MKTKLIYEAGINFGYGPRENFLDNVYRMIDIAKLSECYAIKFQKRLPKICVPENQKNKLKDTPWGTISYLQYKETIELTKEEYIQIDKYCKEKNIKWFASAWDLYSAEFLKDMKCDMIKIPSALITNLDLLRYCRANFKQVHMSTGMSTEEEIKRAVKVCNPDIIYHTNSVYPTPIEDANMKYLDWIKENYIKGKRELGYSSHTFGIQPMICSILKGVKWIEFHGTENRSNWGSDQLASIEMTGVLKLSKAISEMEKAFEKGYGPREVYPGEEKKRESLRGN